MRWFILINIVITSIFSPFVVFAQGDLRPFEIKVFEQHLFDLTSEKPFEFLVEIREATEIQVDMVSEDGDVAKTLYPMSLANKGELVLAWDGTDSQGNHVPNEAWFPVVSYKENDRLISVEPKDYSGGEVVDHVPLTLPSKNRIQISLEKPSRVLIRSGVKSGAMLRTIESWRAMDAGSHIIQWDGLDTSGVYPFTELKGFALMATAYELPEFSVITWGNSKVSYPEWRKQHQFDIAQSDVRPKLNSTRNGRVLSKVFSKPKYLPLDPLVTMAVNMDTARDEAVVNVDIPKEFRGLIENSLYEVGFFIDGEFISEEEQGYVPFVWSFKPSNYSKGQHYLTVNITGFDGQVGVASTSFNVE